MRSRREQLQAHRFLTRRIVSAVLSGEPESPEQPMRRFATAAFASFMVGVIVLAGFAVYGLLRPGGAAGKLPQGALLIEKETGARYVYNRETLYPVLNYASARLVIGAPTVEVRSVSRKSLEGVRRGSPVGIIGAPDNLPDPKSLIGLPWRVCTYRAVEGVNGSVAAALVVGERLTGGAPAEGKGLLVEDPRDRTYLIWENRKYRIRAEGRAALGYTGAATLAVTAAFLEAIPSGPDLKAPKISGLGQPGERIDGRARKVGELFSHRRPGGSVDYYLMLADGLSPISEVTYELLITAPEVAAVHGGKPVATEIDPAGVAEAGSSAQHAEPEFMPATAPTLTKVSGPDPALCVDYRSAKGAESGAQLRLFEAAPAAIAARRADPAARRPAGRATVDFVVVPGGRGSVVLGPNGARYLITDQGLKYGIADDKSLTALGYGDVDPVSVPSDLLRLIPAGPPLDTEVARLVADQDRSGRDG